MVAKPGRLMLFGAQYGQQTGVGYGISLATPWKVREIKRKIAKERDKESIAHLSSKIEQLEWRLWEWHQWYESFVVSWADGDVGSEEFDSSVEHVLHRLSDCPLEEQQRQLQQCQTASVIDYSKWAHIGSSDEEEEEEEDEEGETEKQTEFEYEEETWLADEDCDF